MKRVTVLLCSALVLLLTVASSAQITVDATGPIRARRKEATSGSGGSIGRKLALRVAIETRDSQPNESGETLVMFVLTNLGKVKLRIPISPNPGDLEPLDSDASYTLSCLRLYITSDKAQSASLVPETDLYGGQAFPGSLGTLAPGESLRVLTRVKMSPELSKVGARPLLLVAHVTLNSETIRTISGQTTSDTHEVGSASSSEYSARALLGPGS